MSPRRDDSSDVLSDDQLEEEADGEVHGGAPGPQAVVSHFHVPDVQEQVIEQEIAKVQVVPSTEVPQFCRSVRRFPFVMSKRRSTKLSS